jgi:hypothetical protein
MPLAKRAREVFEALMDLPADARASALDKHCAGDPTLRSEVAAMLESKQQPGAMLGSPTTSIFAKTQDEILGTRIGPYKLLQLLGEGGFGSVFMAEQEQPVTAKSRDEDHQARDGHEAGDRPLRARAPGAGDDGPRPTSPRCSMPARPSPVGRTS